MRQINIEGYSPDEILDLPDDQLDAFVLSARPIVFRVGTAEILGEFKVRGDSLIIELAQIDGVAKVCFRHLLHLRNGTRSSGV